MLILRRDENRSSTLVSDVIKNGINKRRREELLVPLLSPRSGFSRATLYLHRRVIYCSDEYHALHSNDELKR